jgi:hypothetical protein
LLSSLSFGKNLTSLSPGFIKDCTSIKSIEISKDNPNFFVEDQKILSKDGTTVIAAFIFDEAKKVSLSETIISLYPYAFYKNKITELTFGPITVIPTYCFYQCKELKSVTFPESLLTIESYAFSGAMKETQAEVVFTSNKLNSLG